MPTPGRPRLVAAAGIAAAVLALVAAAAASCSPSDAPPPPPPAILVPPLHDVEPGEELRMRRGNEDWVYRVAGVADDVVEVDFLRYLDGRPAAEVQHLAWPRNGFGMPPGFIVRDIRRDRIEAAGRVWDCWVLRAHSQGEVRHYWITPELPVSGFLRTAKDERGVPSPATAAEALPEACVWPK